MYIINDPDTQIIVKPHNMGLEIRISVTIINAIFIKVLTTFKIKKLLLWLYLKNFIQKKQLWHRTKI